MARKATDLLDVFRHGGDHDDGDSRVVSSDRARAAKRAKAKRKAPGKGKGTGKGFDGLILTKRQVVLGASVCCLLVALSFVLGLSAGRPSTDTPAASRTAATGQIVIRGTMPSVHPGNQRPLDVETIREDLVREYRIPASNLRIRRAGGQLILEIGVFQSRGQAEQWLQDSALDMAHLYGSNPFAPAEYVTLR